MVRKRVLLSLAGVLVCALVGATVGGDENLAAVYSAILRGDYQAGRSRVQRLIQEGVAAPPVRRLQEWLDGYEKLQAARAELREKTFQWNVEQARQALERDKLYLALSFTAQAFRYASDPVGFRSRVEVQALLRRALEEGRRLEQELKWSKALAYYTLLERIDEDDPRYKELRDNAGRHVRLEVVYKDRKALERRLEGVNFDLLNQAVHRIQQNYYEAPDFRRMAQGALKQLAALCETTRLYEVFDGLANPALRKHFLAAIESAGAQVQTQELFGARDLLRLYKRLEEANEQSIELPQALLIVEFTEGATGELDDFTSVIWPADGPEFDKLMIGGFQGVGIQLGIDEFTGRLKVVTPLENSPALEAGIQPNDLIIAVDGRSTKGWTTDDAVREITGEAGTTVTLTIHRPGVGDLEFPLVRRDIQIRTVRGVKRVPGSSDEWDYMLDPEQGVAYIRLTGFQPDSTAELDHALKRARQQGMRGLILDLRFNPGGLLDTAVETVGEFLPSGEVVTTRRPRGRDAGETRKVDGKAPYADVPLVVLVNESSASASEILAGALQDHNRAVVLGERTYGKGSVQRVLPLDRRGRARLKLTTDLYFLPSGRTPHKAPDSKTWGVEPDWKVELMPKETAKVIERQTSAYIIHNEKDRPVLDEEARKQALAALKDDSHEESDDASSLLDAEEIALLQSDPHPAPDVDPQLETALLHMRAKLAGDLPWPRQLAARDQSTAHP